MIWILVLWLLLIFAWAYPGLFVAATVGPIALAALWCERRDNALARQSKHRESLAHIAQLERDVLTDCANTRPR